MHDREGVLRWMVLIPCDVSITSWIQVFDYWEESTISLSASFAGQYWYIPQLNAPIPPFEAQWTDICLSTCQSECQSPKPMHPTCITVERLNQNTSNIVHRYTVMCGCCLAGCWTKGNVTLGPFFIFWTLLLPGASVFHEHILHNIIS